MNEPARQANWDAFFLAYRQNPFNIKKVLEDCNIKPYTFSSWLKVPAFKEQYEEEKSALISRAEAILGIAMNSDMNYALDAAKFILKHHKKAQDWKGEKPSMEIRSTGPIQIVLNSDPSKANINQPDEPKINQPDEPTE